MSIRYIRGPTDRFGHRDFHYLRVISRCPKPLTGTCGWDQLNTRITIQFSCRGAGGHGTLLEPEPWAIWLVIFWIRHFVFCRSNTLRSLNAVYPKAGPLMEKK